MNHYFKLHLMEIPQEDLDELTAYLFEHGAEGVVEVLEFIQEQDDYEPEIVATKKTNLDCFFPFSEKENLEILMESKQLLDFSPELIQEEVKDWLSEWKKHYKPFSVSGSLWVYPEWERNENLDGKEVIFIHPGLAFGTGTHATTKMCLMFLEETLKDDNNIGSALDMGAGSGILSILLKKRGVGRVTACEIEDMARDNCQLNLSINNIDNVSVVHPENLEPQTYDLVVANIIDGVLIKLKEQLVKSTKKRLILSGILKENKEKLIKIFTENTGFVHRRSGDLDEWVCLEFLKE